MQVGRERTSGNPGRHHRELHNLAGRLLTQEWTKTCFLHVPKHNVVNSFSNMAQFSVRLLIFCFSRDKKKPYWCMKKELTFLFSFQENCAECFFYQIWNINKVAPEIWFWQVVSQSILQSLDLMTKKSLAFLGECCEWRWAKRNEFAVENLFSQSYTGVTNDQDRVPVAQDLLKIQRVFHLKKY